MNEQKLQKWLQACDATPTEPVLPPLNADCLDQVAALRRRRRRGLAAAGVTTAALALTMWTTSSERIHSRIALTREPEDAATVRALKRPLEAEAKVSPAELDAIQREIDERKALVGALRQADELELLQEELAELEADVPRAAERLSVRIQQVRNEAAATSLFYANALATEFQETELAAAEFRMIVSRYPGTEWSAAAEQALPVDAVNF